MSSDVEGFSGPDLKPAIRLLGWVTACYSFSFVGYLGTTQGIWFWYQTLRRPAWSPPGWMVIPTWTLLYGLLAWASWDVLNSAPDQNRTLGLRLFFVQLGLNALWPWLFYYWHTAVWSIVVLSFLSVSIVGLMICFWRIKPRAGQIIVPYFLWVVFETILCVVVWRLNR